MTVLRNVTQERKVEQMKNEFISIAAHELRTPLACIMGFSEILLQSPAGTELKRKDQEEYLAIIYNKSLALEKIVDNLLDVGRIEKGWQMPLERQPFDLAQVLQQLVCQYRIETPQFRFLLDLETLSLPVDADQWKIQQVLDNLIDNAVKYSPNGGDISISVITDDGLLKVSVRDQGIGMTSAQAQRVFEKFFRADTSNTSRSGFGLGLSICKGIVEAHGGTIWVESAPGLGTTVCFTLPQKA